MLLFLLLLFMFYNVFFSDATSTGRSVLETPVSKIETEEVLEAKKKKKVLCRTKAKQRWHNPISQWGQRRAEYGSRLKKSSEECDRIVDSSASASAEVKGKDCRFQIRWQRNGSDRQRWFRRKSTEKLAPQPPQKEAADVEQDWFSSNLQQQSFKRPSNTQILHLNWYEGVFFYSRKNQGHALLLFPMNLFNIWTHWITRWRSVQGSTRQIKIAVITIKQNKAAVAAAGKSGSISEKQWVEHTLTQSSAPDRSGGLPNESTRHLSRSNFSQGWKTERPWSYRVRFFRLHPWFLLLLFTAAGKKKKKRVWCLFIDAHVGAANKWTLVGRNAI